MQQMGPDRQMKVKCLVIERFLRRLDAPKAHAVNPRTLEICRQFGVDVQRIRQLGTPRGEAFWVNFITSLSGERVGGFLTKGWMLPFLKIRQM